MGFAEVAPLILARISGCPPQRLDAVCQRSTLKALESVFTAEEDLTLSRKGVEDILHRFVPALDQDRSLRRAVLGLRRDVHGLRTPKLAPDQEKTILSLLEARERKVVESWLSTVRVRDSHRAQAVTILGREVEDASRELAAALSDEELQRGVALASSNFLETFLRQVPTTVRPGTQLGRACLSYLARAAVKTSPFSTFTSVGFSGFRSLPKAKGVTTSTSSAARSLALVLLRALARDARTAPAFRYRRNPGFVHDGAAWPALLAEYRVTDGFFWRQERTANAHAYEQILLPAQSLFEGTRDEWLGALREHDGPDVFARLIELSILRPVAPWGRADESPLRRLAEAVALLADPHALNLTALIIEIAESAEAVAANGPRRRLSLLAAVREGSLRCCKLMAYEAPFWLKRGPLVHEDVRFGGRLPILGEHVLQDLYRLGALMRPYIVRASLYDRVVDSFTDEFGRGGTCRDVLSFLRRFLSHPESAALLRKCAEEDATAGNTREKLRSHAPLVGSPSNPTATVFFQLAARSAEEVLEGNYLLVVNQYNPGHGGLFARALCGTSAPKELMRTWMEGAHPGAETLGLPLNTEWNELQHQSIGDHRVLLWPAEWPTSERCSEIALGDLSMTHDPESGLLQLWSSEGRPVAPHYFGVVPHLLFSGPLRLFFVLVDPWINKHQAGMERRLFRPREIPRTVEYSPRLADGRLVLRRAHWRVPRAIFPFAQKGEDPLCFLERVLRWRQLYGIPREVFARAERDVPTLVPAKRKPLWLAFDSLHAMLGLEHFLDEDVKALCLEEALPGREEHWVEGSDGLRRACEWLALLRWQETAWRTTGST